LLHICNGLTFSLLGLLAPYMREEESRLLSWGLFLLLLLVLDLCNALGEGGVATITDSRNISEGVSIIYGRYMREEESRLLSWGSLLLRSHVLDILV
jgi:hypothetical protein